MLSSFFSINKSMLNIPNMSEVLYNNNCKIICFLVNEWKLKMRKLVGNDYILSPESFIIKGYLWLKAP